MKRSRLAADPNYLWISPIDEQILMNVVHVVNDIGFLIPKFISQEYKKMYLFLTDNPAEHGEPLKLGFLFYIDISKIKNASDNDQNIIIQYLIKDGLIKMGEKHGWNEEHINNLFRDIC